MKKKEGEGSMRRQRGKRRCKREIPRGEDVAVTVRRGRHNNDIISPEEDVVVVVGVVCQGNTVAVIVGEDWFVVAAIKGDTVLIWFNRTTNPNWLDSDLTRTRPAQHLGRAPLKSPAQPTYRALGALRHIGTSLLLILRKIYRSGD